MSSGREPHVCCKHGCGGVGSGRRVVGAEAGQGPPLLLTSGPWLPFLSPLCVSPSILPLSPDPLLQALLRGVGPPPAPQGTQPSGEGQAEDGFWQPGREGCGKDGKSRDSHSLQLAFQRRRTEGNAVAREGRCFLAEKGPSPGHAW